jgi:hypothetical protein
MWVVGWWHFYRFFNFHFWREKIENFLFLCPSRGKPKYWLKLSCNYGATCITGITYLLLLPQDRAVLAARMLKFLGNFLHKYFSRWQLYGLSQTSLARRTRSKDIEYRFAAQSSLETRPPQGRGNQKLESKGQFLFDAAKWTIHHNNSASQ